ncbi:hypothetical protein BS78_03G233300 [Paspalum vaginatum]|nr:hypothetical protein BS78_03G233300 [Paspalum vaginatum]
MGRSPPWSSVSAATATPFFVFTPDDDEAKHEVAPYYCKEVITVPVSSSSLAMKSNDDRAKFTSGAYGNVLERGFELVWSYATTDPWCEPCEQSGGQCAYSQHREFLRCLCSGGKAGDPNCADTSANKESASSSGNLTPSHHLTLLRGNGQCFRFRWVWPENELMRGWVQNRNFVVVFFPLRARVRQQADCPAPHHYSVEQRTGNVLCTFVCIAEWRR